MKKAIRYTALLLAPALVTLFLLTGAINRVDRWVQDGLFQRGGVPSADIVIIGIDEYALEQLGPYPANYRDYVAYALEEMAADPDKRPAAVAIDILYEGSTSESADRHLASAASRLDNVIVASMAVYGRDIKWENNRASSLSYGVTDYILPFDELRNAAAQGLINAMYDTDGVMRHALLYEDIPGEGRVYSMPVEAARLYLASRGEELSLPDERFIYVPYSSKPGMDGYSDGVSIAQVIFGQVPVDYWAGKLVIIGPYAAALQDAYFTPADRGRQMYGVEIQANVIQTLLEQNHKADIPDVYQYVAVFVIGLAAMWLFRRLNPAWGVAMWAAITLLGFGASMLLYSAGWVTHPLWAGVSAFILYLIALAIYLVELMLKYLRTEKERHRLELEKERIQAELTLATRIQESALIKEFPAFPDKGEFDVFASMTPAKEVGGDLYDLFMPDDGHLVIVIGDVSGKGVPAARLMMVTLMLIRHMARTEMSPAAILAALNEEICARNPEEMFVTVWLGVLEINRGRLMCANAGHEYPAIKRPGGSFELIKDKHGFVVGGMEGVRYREYERFLEPGTKLFLYTDGLTEANDKNEALFGTERMLEALIRAQNGTPEEILASVKGEVAAFTGDAPQFDDLTMLCLTYNGSNQANS